MWELRWVLLGLGALVVVGVYLWGRGYFRRAPSFKLRRAERVEPLIEPVASGGTLGDLLDVPEPAAFEPDPHADRPPEREPEPEAPKPKAAAPDRVIALRLIPHDRELDGETVVKALHDTDLEHGRYGIFHRMAPGNTEPVFSVASLTEPGTFDLENIAGTTLAGVTLFMVLPGVGDPVARFDAMVMAARSLAVTLDGELYDERGSSWSVQRERYVREEVIEYRHQLERR